MLGLFLIVVVVFVGIMPVLGTRLQTRYARGVPLRRAIERPQTTAVAALQEGERAKIRGVAAAREPLLTSPISGHACIGYRVIIDDVSHDPALSWTPLVSREEWPSFLVTDETGTVVVQGPFEILVDPTDGGSNPPASAYALLEEDNVRMKDPWGAREFWFRETLLKVGDRVSVLGRPSSLEIDSAGRAPVRAPPRLHVMRGSEGERVVIMDDDEPVG